jgi:N,N'-diacetyllegionaminate synthase
MEDKVIIIAEAGVNHNGDINLAYKLIDSAAAAGADYVKFQTFITELIVDPKAEKASYQKSSSGENETQFEMIKKLELSFDDFHKLKQHCDKKGIKFLTTAADLKSLDKIHEYEMDFNKISSGELTNIIFLRKAGKKEKPIVLSTGMATLGDIETAIGTLINVGVRRDDITLLHCNTEYPTPFEDVNLKAMVSLGYAFGTKMGYSDHTLGIEVPIAAVALGARVIEKHFTLDKLMPGPDHSASLDPDELKLMVKAIRNIELALSGSGLKEPSQSERKNISIVRKSVFSSAKIAAGEIFTEENIVLKRPGDGISAIEIDKVLGKRASVDIEPGIKMTYKDISW